MNQIKKSQAKYLVFFLTGFLLLFLGIFLHPTTRSLFPQYRTDLFTELIPVISQPSSQAPLAQKFWQFREFYSRGEITLAKYSELQVSEQITQIISVPEDFSPYLKFESSKIISYEGSVSNKEDFLISQEELKTTKWLDWQLKADSTQYQIFVNESQQKAITLTRFDLEPSSKANGYLHFDLREDEFKEKHSEDVWVTMSLVDLN